MTNPESQAMPDPRLTRCTVCQGVGWVGFPIGNAIGRATCGGCGGEGWRWAPLEVTAVHPVLDACFTAQERFTGEHPFGPRAFLVSAATMRALEAEFGLDPDEPRPSAPPARLFGIPFDIDESVPFGYVGTRP